MPCEKDPAHESGFNIGAALHFEAVESPEVSLLVRVSEIVCEELKCWSTRKGNWPWVSLLGSPSVAMIFSPMSGDKPCTSGELPWVKGNNLDELAGEPVVCCSGKLPSYHVADLPSLGAHVGDLTKSAICHVSLKSHNSE